MTISEEKLAINLKKENVEFRKLAVEHEDLKKRIREMDKNKFLTPDQEAEITSLKKLKLRGKEKMHKILAEYRRKMQ